MYLLLRLQISLISQDWLGGLNEVSSWLVKSRLQQKEHNLSRNRQYQFLNPNCPHYCFPTILDQSQTTRKYHWTLWCLFALLFQYIMFFRHTLETRNSRTLLNFSLLENPVKSLKYFFSLFLPRARSRKTVSENLCSRGIAKFDWMERETKFTLEVSLHSLSPSDAVSDNSDSRTAFIFSIFLLFSGKDFSGFFIILLKIVEQAPVFRFFSTA